VNNTIVAGNSDQSGMNDIRRSGTLNASNCLIQNLPAGTINGINTANITGVAPLLGPLQDNGGPTQTLALLPGSPAIDKGSNALIPTGLTTDQRGVGFNRSINGTVDIGAYEYQPPATTTNLVSSLNSTSVGQMVTFTATVTATVPGSNAIQGTVSFLDGSTTLGTVMLSATGFATFTTSTLTAGPHSITAQYNGFTLGNYTFTTSTSTAVSEVVNAPPQPSPPTPPTPATVLPPFVSVSFLQPVSDVLGPFGQAVLEVVSSTGVLTQFDASGAHQLATGVRSASAAFGTQGEVLIVVFQNGQLFQFDAAGTHFLASGILSANVACASAGTQEVLEVVFADGTLVQFDAASAHQLATGVRSASVAFGSIGEVMDLVFQSGQLVQFDPSGVHVLANGVTSAAVALSPVGVEVLDVLFADSSLWQFDATGGHKLGAV
jgi:hypothetical protein